ncbi:MAG: RHS repeat-associated core domain-containing protein [Chakrabartia sp.]
MRVGLVKSVTHGTAIWQYAIPNIVSNEYTSSRTDPLLRKTSIVGGSYTENPKSLILSSTDGLGRTSAFEYDGLGRVARITSPEDNVTTLAYDARGNLTESRVIAKAGSGLADIVSTATYPSTCTSVVTCNKPTSSVDAKGNVTTYTYDPVHGGLLSVTSPPAAAGGIAPQTRYTYSALQAYYKGSTGVIAASGQTHYLLTGTSVCQNTASCIGSADEVRTTTNFGPQTAGVGNTLLPVSTTTGSGDGALSATMTYGYDIIGNRTTLDGPLAGTADTARTRYDAARQIVGIVSPDPDGAGGLSPKAQRTTYNLDGQVTLVEIGTVVDQSDAAWAGFTPLESTSTVYDGIGRKVKEIKSGGGTQFAVQHYAYDAANQLICTAVRMDPAQWGSQTDACTPQTTGPNGPDRVTKLVYNAAGERITLQLAVGTPVATDEETSTYTLNGKLATIKDGENNLTTYEYDGHDRLAKTRFPVPTFGAALSSTTDYEQLTYDPNGNVTQRRLRDGQMILSTYDNLNRVTLKDVPNTVPYEFDISYSYDLLGRATQLSHPISANSFTYDGLGRRVSETSLWGAKTSDYDLEGRRTKITHSDGFSVSYDYDVVGNVTAIRENGAVSGVGVLATYAYDNLGRRISLTRGNGAVTTYAYDSISRLSSLAQDFVGSTSDVAVTLSRNPASQIASYSRSNDSYAWGGHYNVNRNYTVNGLNQLTTAGATALGYDGRGNLTSSGSNTYSYTSENRMATGPNGAQLLHDAQGRLLFTSGYVGATQTVTYFDYDGTSLLSERQSGSGAVLRRYVYGPGTDEPLVWYEGSGTTDRRWLHADERGSVIAVSNSAGSVIAVNAYDEYGIPAPTNIGRFQYTGQTWLPEVGLYYYKARIYSPTLGRFMQTDPIGYGDGINWYDYVDGDPVNRSDPTGTVCVPANGLSDYCRRGELYRRLDQKFSGQTRFFAAASMTTVMLANLSFPGLNTIVSSDTRRFMTGLSGNLESMNMRMARNIESGRLGGAGLDARMVHAEQTVVQAHLNALGAGARNSIVSEVNSLLNPSGATAAAASFYRSDRGYQNILNGVREQVGGKINFGNQSHREAIGNALIKELRSSGACTHTGSRIPTC